jgi:hypothetical protein
LMERMILGMPDDAILNEKRLKEYLADFALREAKDSDAVARLLAGTQKAETAEKAEVVQGKELDVKAGALDVEQVGNEVKKQIQESVKKRIGSDKDFARIADFAGIGALALLVERYQSSRYAFTLEKQAQIERMKGLLQINDAAAREFRERYNKWNAERAKLHDPIELSLLRPGYDRLDEAGKDAVQKELLDRHLQQNPQPSFDAILEEHLGSRGVGMSEFQGAMRDLLKLDKEAQATEDTSAAGTATAAPNRSIDRVAVIVQAVKEGKKKADGTPYSVADIDASNMLSAAEKKKAKELLEGKKP